MKKFFVALIASLALFGFAFAEDLEPTVTFTLNGGVSASGFVYVGVGGDIDGIENPDLVVTVGDVVEIILYTTDGMAHDFAIDELDVLSEKATVIGTPITYVFEVNEAGEWIYWCTEPGHALKEIGFGMLGNFIANEAE